MVAQLDFDRALNLANSRIGAEIKFATDEWFACAHNLLKAEPPTFDPNAFCSQGKVMDGWETRRKRTAGHDWCIIKLAYPCFSSEVEFDTRWFTGNFVPQCSVYGICLNEEQAAKLKELPGVEDGRLGTIGTGLSVEEVEMAEKIVQSLGTWRKLTERTPLTAGYEGKSITRVPISDSARITHVRLNYFPDGGVARLRVRGNVVRDFSKDSAEGKQVDLLFCGNGGKGVICSNRHYGIPSNMLQPGRGVNMGDGWETARHPSRPGIVEIDASTGLSKSNLSDWAILQMGAPTAQVTKLVIDTCHFKGNFPESVLVEQACIRKHIEPEQKQQEAEVSTPKKRKLDDTDSNQRKRMKIEELKNSSWTSLLPRTKMTADAIHTFELSKGELKSSVSDKVTHLRLTMFPDGGVMRVKAFGVPLME